MSYGKLTVHRPAAPPDAPARKRFKGQKHVSAVPGPWASAVASMPPPPLSTMQRVAAGLADVPVDHDHNKRIESERAARALIAILPYGCAGFVIRDPPDAIAARAHDEIVERLVSILQSRGSGSLSQAATALGGLLTWALSRVPPIETVHGSHFYDYCKYKTPSNSAMCSFTWLRDHCGINLPVRSDVDRPFRGAAPERSGDVLSFPPMVVYGFEALSYHGETEFVRSHAAAWYVLAKARLRMEQSRGFVVNSFFEHDFDGRRFTFASVSLLREKHPDPSKQKPRPLWFVVDGVLFPKAPREALERMLERAPAVRSLFLDTDSPSGDVTHPSTSRWVLSPIESPARVDASLHGLLRLIGLDPAQASRYHGHSAKRFMLSLAEQSPRLDEHDSLELGAFSLSTSQRANLTPGEALLRAHTLQISALPQRYAGQRAVKTLLDRIARAELELHRLADRIAACDPDADLGLEAGFELLSP